MRVLILDTCPAQGLAARLQEVLGRAAGCVGGGAGRWGEVRVEETAGPAGLVACLRREDPALVFLCVTGSTRSEAEALLATVEDVGRREARRPVILAGTAMEPGAMCALVERGAMDFVLEPFSPVDLAARLLRAGCEAGAGPAAEGGNLGPEALGHLLGRDPGWLGEVEKIPLLARCGASVLILGETGTGKELCARAIHQLGARRDRPFTPVNCGAIPPELVENELFGHTCGAYTGAVHSATGIVQAAEGGTLFLDEVDALPLGAQVKLLRFLQSREYRQVGGARLLQSDVRIVAASNVELSEAVRAGRFRSDLYYRLNVMLLRLPPLRARRADIPLLARHFLERFGEENGKDLAGLSGPAQQRLLLHDWPGNIRELENVLERAVIVARGPWVQAGDISLTGGAEPEELLSFKAQKARAVAAFEREYLQQMLVAHDGNISRAARAAQKNRRAFWELLRKHRLRVFRAETPDPRMMRPG